MLTKKKFATKCGIKTKDLSVYIIRSQVIQTKNGLINDQNEHNYAFLIKKGIAKYKAKVKPKTKPLMKSIANPVVETPLVDPEMARHILELAELDKLKKQADVDKLMYEIELKRIAVEKQQGLLIPTELATSVIQLQAESLKTSYYAACERLIIVIIQKKKLKNQEMANIRKELTCNINYAIDYGIEEALKGIKRIVEEYSKHSQ